MKRASDNVVRALAVTCEVMGLDVSAAAARVMAHDLADFDEHQVLRALERCRKEVKGARLMIADIIDRLEDGRPGPEEAWAEAPRDETSSAVWCAEQRQAWAAARTLLAEGEVVQARMTFLEVYRKACRESREAGIAPAWEATLGTDLYGREQCLLRAVQVGRIKAAYAVGLLPDVSRDSAIANPNGQLAGLFEAAGLPLLLGEKNVRAMLDLTKGDRNVPARQDASDASA